MRDSIEVLAEQENENLEKILSGIQDGWIVIDFDQRLRLVNQAARRAFGILPQDPLTGKRFQDIFPQRELMDLASAAEGSRSNDTEITLKDERVFRVQASLIDGVGRVLILHDISEYKKLDQIKTDFVHTLSHDLRSPLTAIMGYVELIERAGPVTDLQRDFIRRVHISVHNITHLMDDLLDLGKIESSFDIRKEYVRLEQITCLTVEGKKKPLTEKNLQVRIQFPDNFPVVLADPVQMRQMLDQLLDNALKYSPPGSTITVTGQLEANQAILQVSDNGIGIPVLDLPFIFEKFYRASNASGELSGTGLGLAIVKSIVENHAGRIWVDSTVGSGSIFTIVLPSFQS